jgi:hypothetical protein
MARTPIVLHPVVLITGTLLTATAVTADGLEFSNPNGDVFIYAVNAGGAPHILTFSTPLTVQGLAVVEHTVTVANSTFRLIGPFPRTVFNQVTGVVYINCDGTPTEVSCAAVQFEKTSL